jgi:hypothetical protein
MGKTRTFRVISNRIQFICPTCRTRKFSMVPRVLRRKNMKCSKCSEVTRCILDRRTKPRELQSGKVLMLTGGKELEVFLHDISIDGIGVDLPVRALRSGKLTTGREVRFKCSWNPRLINGNFVVNNVKDQRVGVEKVGR